MMGTFRFRLFNAENRIAVIPIPRYDFGSRATNQDGQRLFCEVYSDEAAHQTRYEIN